MARKRKQSLTQSMYYVLLSLREKRHGYEIMQYIDWLTESRVQVGPGTLYSMLARFEEDGYIEKISSEENKKIYQINELGEEVLEDEIQRLVSLLKDARIVRGGIEDEFKNRI